MSLAFENRNWSNSPYGHGESVNTEHADSVAGLIQSAVGMPSFKLRRLYVNLMETLIDVAHDMGTSVTEMYNAIEDAPYLTEWELLAALYDCASLKFENESQFYRGQMSALNDRMDSIKSEGIAA